MISKAMKATLFGATLGLLMLGATPARATITVVQHANATTATTGSSTSLSRAFPSANTAGNLLVVAVSTYSGETISPPTDSVNNTYALAVGASRSGNAVAAIYYAANCKGGANTVTAHISAADNVHLHIYEISGMATSAPVDVTGSNISNTATSLTVSTSGSTTSANDYVFAYFADNATPKTFTAGAGYGDTEQSESSGDAGFSEDKIVSSTGTQTATATESGADPITALIATFKAGSGGPTPILSVLPTSLTFAAVAGGVNPATQAVNVSNSGTNLSSLSFTASSDSSWLVVNPTGGLATGGGVPVAVTVSATTPAAAATLTGHITFTASGASGSPAIVTVAFNVNAVQHSVVTNWAASTSTGAQYNVYRAPGSCGTPSQTAIRLNASPINGTTYTDSTPASGTTYCYYGTAVVSGVESAPANMVSVAIPTP